MVQARCSMAETSMAGKTPPCSRCCPRMRERRYDRKSFLDSRISVEDSDRLKVAGELKVSTPRVLARAQRNEQCEKYDRSNLHSYDHIRGPETRKGRWAFSRLKQVVHTYLCPTLSLQLKSLNESDTPPCPAD